MGNERHVATAKKKKEKKFENLWWWCSSSSSSSREVFVFHHLCCSSLLVFLTAAWISRHMKRQCTCTPFFFCDVEVCVPEKGNVTYCTVGGEISLVLTQNELRGNNRRGGSTCCTEKRFLEQTVLRGICQGKLFF